MYRVFVCCALIVGIAPWQNARAAEKDPPPTIAAPPFYVDAPWVRQNPAISNNNAPIAPGTMIPGWQNGTPTVNSVPQYQPQMIYNSQPRITPPPQPAWQQPQPQRAAVPPEAQQRPAQRPERRSSDPFIDEANMAVGSQQWMTYDIRPYTARFKAAQRPEEAVRNVILEQTGKETWHGGEVTALSVSQDFVRVYHNPEVQGNVAKIVGRFVNYQPGRFNCTIYILNVRQPTWRSEYAASLKPINVRSAGKQAWLIDRYQGKRLLGQLTYENRATLLSKPVFAIGNGQEASVDWRVPGGSYIKDIVYEGQVSRKGGATLQPLTGQLTEGMSIRMRPLVDDHEIIVLDLAMNANKIAGGEDVRLKGPGKPIVEIPDVRTSELSEEFRIIPGKQLLVSMGIMPSWDPKRRLFFKDKTAEMLVLFDLQPDQSNAVVEQLN